MTKMAFEFNDLKGFLFLVLLSVPLTSSTNINCKGKPFHCLNSTHFMICVDLGGGVSSTIDDFVIQCPPTTVCDVNNIFECEFPKFEEPLYVIGVSKVNDDTSLPPLIDTSTSTPIDVTNVKAPIEKNIETVLSQQEPITDPWPEDVLEDLKEEFLGSKEKFFDLPVIAETSTVRYRTEGILTTNLNISETNATDQNILTTTTTLNPSSVIASVFFEINNTTVLNNTRHNNMNNGTTMLPEDTNLNVSRNETHKQGSNFSSNVQQIIINNTNFQTEHIVNKINETILNITFFDGSSDLTPKNTDEEKIFRPLQMFSTTLLPQNNNVQIELDQLPDTTSSKQFDVLSHNTNLTSTNPMLNDVSEATPFRIDSGLVTSTKEGELVTVVNNSLTQMLQDDNTLDNDVATATEVTEKISGFFDNTNAKFAKDIKVSALPLSAEGVQALIDPNSPLPNNTVQLNNNLVTTEHNVDGSSSLPVENIEITTRKMPYINKVMDHQPGLLFLVAEQKEPNNTVPTDLPFDQVQEHKLIRPGYNLSEPVKNEVIDSTNTTYLSTNQRIEHNMELSSLTTGAKYGVIKKNTTTESNVGLNLPYAKEDNDTKNSTIRFAINQSLTNSYDGLNSSTLVQKSEAINKTDKPGTQGVDASSFIESKKDNFTTAMSMAKVSATHAPQAVIPENTDILSKNILTSNIQTRIINDTIVQGGHNNNSVNDMSRNIPNKTFITSETITYSDNINNKTKITDDINVKLYINLGNAFTSNNSTDMLSENVSKVIIESGNDTKHLITTLSATGSKISQDKDNNTIYDANINGTNEKDIAFILSSNIQSNNGSKEYSTKDNKEKMLNSAFDISGGIKIDAGNEEPSRLKFSNKLSNNSREFSVNNIVETEYSNIPNFVTPASEAIRGAENINLGLSHKAVITFTTDTFDKQTEGTEPTIIQNYYTNITVTKSQDIDNTDIFNSTPVSSDNIMRTTLKNNNARDINSNDLMQVENPLGMFLSVKENVSDSIRSTTASTENLPHVQKYSTKDDNVQLQSTSTLLSDIIMEAMELTTIASVNSKIDDLNKISDTVDLTKISVDEYNTNENVNKLISLTPELKETNKSNVININSPTIDRQSQNTVKDSTKPEPTISMANFLVHDDTLNSLKVSENTLQPNLITVINMDQHNSQVSSGKLNDTNHNTSESSLTSLTNYMINDSNKTVMQSESNLTKESIKFDTTDMPFVSNTNVTTTDSLSNIVFFTEAIKANITAVTESNNVNDAEAENNTFSTEQSNINVFIAKTTKPKNIQPNTTEKPPIASAVIGEPKNDTNVENRGVDKTKTGSTAFAMPVIFASKDQNVKITKPTNDTPLIVKSQIRDNVNITTTDMPYTLQGNEMPIKTADIKSEKNVMKPILTFNLPKKYSNQNDLSITNYSKKQMALTESNLKDKARQNTDNVLVTKTSNDIHSANTISENYTSLKEEEITTILKRDKNMEVPTTHIPISEILMIAGTSTIEQESPLLTTVSSFIESTYLPTEKNASYSKTLSLPTGTATIAKQLTSTPAFLEPTRLLEDFSIINAAQTSFVNRSTVIHNSDIKNISLTEPPSIVETINSDNFKHSKDHILEHIKLLSIVNKSSQQENNSSSQNLKGEAESVSSNPNITEDFQNKNIDNFAITPTTTNIYINIDSIYNNSTSSFSTVNNDNVPQGDKSSSSPAFVIHSINIAKSNNSMSSSAVEAALTIPHLTHNDKSTNESSSNLWLLRNTTTNGSKPVINVSDTDKVKNNNDDEYSISQTKTTVNNLTNHNVKNYTNMGTRKAFSNSSTNSQIKLNNSEPAFDCSTHPRGKYADSKDCRKFYTCIGKNDPAIGICPNHTVFSEINKQCTRNLSHCVRNNQFRCMYGGRFSDFLKDNIYYICVKNGHHSFLRYTLQCQSSYHLNKANVKCEENEKEESQSTLSAASGGETSTLSEDKSLIKSEDDDKSTKKNDGCKKEGKFPYPKDCTKYYVCSKNIKNEYRRKIKKCSSDEVYDKEDKKCVSADSTEC